jgi:hypothetical protein
MEYDIFPTTAETIISSIDVVLLSEQRSNAADVARFLDTKETYAGNALKMAAQLGFIQEEAGEQFVPRVPYACYLVSSKPDQKAVVLRFLLEDYRPYSFFKARLDVVQDVMRAAQETKVFLNITADKDEIKDTLISLGQYTQSIESAGAGIFNVAPLVHRDAPFLRVLQQVVSDREASKTHVRRRLGDQATSWIDPHQVLDPLVTGLQKLADPTDTKGPIQYAGNAIDSFLAQVAREKSVPVASAHGINAKASALLDRKVIAKKQKALLKYLGDIRNAADHGTDSEIGTTWDIAGETTIEYVSVAVSAIRSIVARIKGQYIL